MGDQYPGLFDFIMNTENRTGIGGNVWALTKLVAIKRFRNLAARAENFLGLESLSQKSFASLEDQKVFWKNVSEATVRSVATECFLFPALLVPWQKEDPGELGNMSRSIPIHPEAVIFDAETYK